MSSVIHELYAGAIQYVSTLVGGCEGIIPKMLIHQQYLGVQPLWPYIRLALKIAHREGDHRTVLQCYSNRKLAKNYKSGDEKMFEYVLKSSDATGKWTMIIDIVHDLLREKASPNPLVFETAMRLLSDNYSKSSVRFSLSSVLI